jgi:hypothetical protein
MKLVWRDNNGYPIEGFIGKPIKSFLRLVCQIIRGNSKLIIIQPSEKIESINVKNNSRCKCRPYNSIRRIND